MKSVIKLKIADIIIELKSKFKMAPLDRKESFRFTNFIYKGEKKSDICLEIIVVNKLPSLNGAERLFLTRHPQSKEDNWAIFKNGNGYILREYLEDKQQHISLNSNLSKGKALVLPSGSNRLIWKLTDIIYDALQVILLTYLSKRDSLFVHSMGVKDRGGRGLIFIGKSGQGKSTLARIWHNFSKAKVLNDDRIIIRNNGGCFLMHSSPWHGDFSDYLVSKVDRAKIKSIFFLSHGKANSAKSISAKRAFNLLFPCLFPTFWDKAGLIKSINLSQGIIKNSSCFRLAFKNDKQIISFVRAIKLRNEIT